MRKAQHLNLEQSFHQEWNHMIDFLTKLFVGQQNHSSVRGHRRRRRFICNSDEHRRFFGPQAHLVFATDVN